MKGLRVLRAFGALGLATFAAFFFATFLTAFFFAAFLAAFLAGFFAAFLAVFFVALLATFFLMDFFATFFLAVFLAAFFFPLAFFFAAIMSSRKGLTLPRDCLNLYISMSLCHCDSICRYRDSAQPLSAIA